MYLDKEEIKQLLLTIDECSRLHVLWGNRINQVLENSALKSDFIEVIKQLQQDIYAAREKETRIYESRKNLFGGNK